jgi:hypothetical protein
MAEACPLAAARPTPEPTAVATKDAVLKKSLREMGIIFSSFRIFIWKSPRFLKRHRMAAPAGDGFSFFGGVGGRNRMITAHLLSDLGAALRR